MLRVDDLGASGPQIEESFANQRWDLGSGRPPATYEALSFGPPRQPFTTWRSLVAQTLAFLLVMALAYYAWRALHS